MYGAALRFELEGCKALARTTCIRAWDRVNPKGFGTPVEIKISAKY